MLFNFDIKGLKRHTIPLLIDFNVLLVVSGWTST